MWPSTPATGLAIRKRIRCMGLSPGIWKHFLPDSANGTECARLCRKNVELDGEAALPEAELRELHAGLERFLRGSWRRAKLEKKSDGISRVARSYRKNRRNVSISLIAFGFCGNEVMNHAINPGMETISCGAGNRLSPRRT